MAVLCDARKAHIHFRSSLALLPSDDPRTHPLPDLQDAGLDQILGSLEIATRHRDLLLTCCYHEVSRSRYLASNRNASASMSKLSSCSPDQQIRSVELTR